MATTLRASFGRAGVALVVMPVVVATAIPVSTCLVWVHNGNEHTEAPVGLIADAIFWAVYGRPQRQRTVRGKKLNENLGRFFAGKRRREATSDRAAVSSCC